MSEEQIKPGLENAEKATAEVYSTRSVTEILNQEYVEPEEIWGGLRLAPGQIMEVIGGSGLGKSRMMLDLAICQVLGQPFAGMKTLNRPLTWLFYGNENSFFRFRNDLGKMTSTLSSKAKDLLGEHIFLPTMENSTDAFVSFNDGKNVARLKATMELRRPDVLVMDPWGSVIAGDELNDGDVRHTITNIYDVLATNKDKPAVAIILNHSRNGLKEWVNADGPNAANFGKNSKAIFSVVRNVWNLRAGKITRPITKIELIHAKCSDGMPYDPVAVDLNENTLRYQVDPTFQHEAWQAELERMCSSGSTMSVEEKNLAKAETVDKQCEQVLRYVDACKGPIRKKELDGWMKGIGVSKDNLPIVYKRLVEEHKLAEATHRADSVKWVWTTEKMTKYLHEQPPDEYRQSSCTPFPGKGGKGGSEVFFSGSTLGDPEPSSVTTGGTTTSSPHLL